ncbi:MAG: amidohydrolase family protein [Rhodospirillales bacterium]|nr:MAG: amidohydrolase family protein [Rhodospirillales bacterium]
MATLYIGGKLFDGETARDGHAVLEEGGRVKRVAPAGEFAGFAGPRIDTSGGTLLPGLIDCHVHSLSGAEGNPGLAQDRLSAAQIAMRGLEYMQRTLQGGITAVRECGGKDYIEFALRDAINAGRFAGPTMRCSGRMICMTGGHGNRTGRVADGVDEVIKAVREQIHAGSDLVKIMATGGVMTPGVNPEDAHYTAEEMSVGIREATRFNKTTASHAQGAEGILNAVRGGVTSIEHGIFMTDECVLEMQSRGTWLVPTLSAVQNILKGADSGDKTIPDYVVEKSRRVFERHIDSVKMYYAAGCKIAMGTDAGTPYNHHGDNAMELEYMCGVGISTRDSLFFSTASAADLMRLSDQGRVREGNSADLLVVEGDPLRDIAMAARKENHRLVVKRGAIVRDNRGADAAMRVAAQ